MKFSLVLAALPSLALAKGTFYAAPPMLLAKANDPSNNCVLPVDYQIRNFVAQSNDTGVTLSAYNFAYNDAETNSSTTCHFDATSKPRTPGGSSPRFECEDRNVEFLWQSNQHKLWMIQRVCPGTTGIPAYEVTGSVVIPLSCDGTGTCRSNQTEYRALFTSLNPIRHDRLRRADVVRHTKKAIAWADDV